MQVLCFSLSEQHACRLLVMLIFAIVVTGPSGKSTWTLRGPPTMEQCDPPHQAAEVEKPLITVTKQGSRLQWDHTFNFAAASFSAGLS